MMPLSQEPDRNNAHLSLLERVGNLISSSRKSKEVLDKLLDELASGLNTEACWIQSLDPDEKELTLIAHRGFTAEMAQEMRSLKLKQSLSGKVALTGESLISSDISTDPKYTLTSPIKAGFHSLAAVPLKSGSRILGVMGLFSSAPNRFTEYELKLLSIISTYAAIVPDKVSHLHHKEKQGEAELLSTINEKQEFLNMLSHELQTPLTALIASAGLLAEELEREQNSSHLRLIQNIIRSASNLESRLNELLDLSRAKTSGFRIKRKAIDFSMLVKEISEEVSSLIKTKEQSLVIKVPTSLIVAVDEYRLEQILLNLLSNAIKFTPDGGQITIRAKAKKNLIVEIQDTGTGISKEEQINLFHPYYRALPDRHRFPGIGLGLFITKQLVELHGGTIWVESDPGKGSTFAFLIPLSEEEKER